MNIRVLVLSPFHYVYGSKNFFVSCGDSIYFDLENPEEKNELIYILSPKSEYKNWIYVEESEVSEILNLIKKEFEGEVISSNEIVEGRVDSTPPVVNLETPPLEPEDNIFLNPEVHSQVEKLEKEEIKGSEESLVEEVNNEFQKDPEIEAKIVKRRIELDLLHYTKVKKLAEALGLSYTEKDETIEEILKAEFNY